MALTPKHVLVIDDEALVREQFARALRGLGHTVDLAESGAQGLVRYQGSKRRYDVVVLDVVMPGLSGLRRLDPGVRAVVTSGFALDGDNQAILDEGARVFLPKPFLRDSLSKALAEACASEESAKK